jgi:hypothetical protein
MQLQRLLPAFALLVTLPFHYHIHRCLAPPNTTAR